MGPWKSVPTKGLLSAIRLCDPILHDIVVMLLGFVLHYWSLLLPEGHHFQIPVSHQAAWHIWYTGTKSLRKYKIRVFNFSELMICESVAGNGYHRAQSRIKTRLVTDPWWHSCMCEDFIFPPVDLGERARQTWRAKSNMSVDLTKELCRHVIFVPRGIHSICDGFNF